MGRSKSSHKWLRTHFEDEYVKRAQQEGYRSRAVYKLAEIQTKDHILRPGMTVIDLGAAPGGWSQYAAARLKGRGRVLALDILPMQGLPGVECIEGDFREDEVLDSIMEKLGDAKADLVMSDMAPNISGMRTVDQPRSMYLVELAVELADKALKDGGNLLCKVFQGEGFEELLRELRGKYSKVLIRKPKASRPHSREVYILAQGRKHGNV